MKTLAEHDAERLPHYIIQSPLPLRNGIACPRCGEEMWDSSPNVTLTSNPPKKNVHCACGYVGYRIA